MSGESLQEDGESMSREDAALRVPEPGSDLRRARVSPDLRASLGAGLFTAIVLSALVAGSAQDLWHKDGLDYAQIAREISEGHGFSSRQAIYALHLRFLEQRDGMDAAWPSVHRFPLLSIATAGLFRFFGANAFSVYLTGILALAITSGILHLWARQCLGRWPAVATTWVLTFNAALYFGVQAGMPESLACLFTTASLYLLWRGSRSSSAATWGGVGGALGLATLARTNVVTLAPFVIAEVFRVARVRRIRMALLCSVTMLAVLSPWLIRNVAVAGSPTFSLHSYLLVPSLTTPDALKRNYSLDWVRDFVSPLAYARAHPVEVWNKWERNTQNLLLGYPRFGATWLLPLLAWATLLPALRGSLRGIPWVVLAGLVANALVCGFTDLNLGQYYQHLLPALILLGIAATWGIVQRIPGTAGPRLVFAALVVVMASPGDLRSAVLDVKRTSARAVDHAQMQYLRENTAEDAIVFSDQSMVVTWYAGRRSIRHHYTTAPDGQRTLALLELDREFGPIDAAFLSGEFLASPDGREMLGNLTRTEEFSRLFACREPFPDGAVFCSRRRGSPR
jgi:4-amino-4-deoxy-L-arabinose transferase-like glycosyltransferase